MAERLATLDKLGVRTFAPLVYPHKPGMGRWLTEWVMEFAAHTPGAVPTATLYPEPDVADYLGAAVAAGARLVKVHVQVGGFDPRDPLLRPAWGLLAEAGVPAIVHCGHGPLRGAHTGLDVFGEVLAAHPRLPRGARPRRDAGFRGRARPRAPLRARVPGHDDGRRPVQPVLRPAPATTGPPGSSTSPTASSSAPTSRTSRTPTPSSCGRSPGGRRPTTGSATPFLRSVLHDAPARLLGEPG